MLQVFCILGTARVKRKLIYLTNLKESGLFLFRPPVLTKSTSTGRVDVLERLIAAFANHTVHTLWSVPRNPKASRSQI